MIPDRACAVAGLGILRDGSNKLEFLLVVDNERALLICLRASAPITLGGARLKVFLGRKHASIYSCDT